MHDHMTHARRHDVHVFRTHVAKKDPTRTTALRVRFTQEVNRRFANLRRLVVSAVKDHNILALSTNAIPDKRFDFTRDPKKVSEFMKWVNSETNAQILGTRKGTTVTSAHDAWANVYLDSAYQKGLAQAAAELRGEGVRVSPTWATSAFFRPVHADAIGVIYTRAFDALKGVTAEMSSQMGAVLAQGLAEGVGADALAKMLSDRIDSIGRTRARLIARTEVISAHATATLNTYREAGVEGVGVQAEFSTAGDDDVCPECDAISGQVFTLDEADGMIPIHPNCRCAWLPVVDDPAALSLGEGPDAADDVSADDELPADLQDASE